MFFAFGPAVFPPVTDKASLCSESYAYLQCKEKKLGRQLSPLNLYRTERWPLFPIPALSPLLHDESPSFLPAQVPAMNWDALPPATSSSLNLCLVDLTSCGWCCCLAHTLILCWPCLQQYVSLFSRPCNPRCVSEACRQPPALIVGCQISLRVGVSFLQMRLGMGLKVAYETRRSYQRYW